mgnify:CR=1 FL=1
MANDGEDCQKATCRLHLFPSLFLLLFLTLLRTLLLTGED